MIDLIGYFGAFLTTASFVPQAFQTIRTRNTDGISLAMYVMFVSGVIFWLLYGCLIDNKILIFSNSIVLTLSGMILWVKISNILNKKWELIELLVVSPRRWLQRGFKKSKILIVSARRFFDFLRVKKCKNFGNFDLFFLARFTVFNFHLSSRCWLRPNNNLRWNAD